MRTQLSACLVGVIAQRVVRSTKGKLVLALEVLVNNRAVANMIHEGKIPMLHGTMETGRQVGMQTMDQALSAPVEGGTIAPSEAKRYTSLFESRPAQLGAAGTGSRSRP